MADQDHHPHVELGWDFDTAGYFVVVDGEVWVPLNGVGTFATRGEALEAWSEEADRG